MKGKTGAGGGWTVVGMVAVLVAGSSGPDPAAVAGTMFPNTLSNTLPPGALVWRGPHAGSTNAPATATHSTKAIFVLPATLKLPSDLAEVVRLHAAGVGDEAILAHIQNAPPVRPINPDQIIYLTDLGISPRVLTAMLQRQAPPQDQSAADSQ